MLPNLHSVTLGSLENATEVDLSVVLGPLQIFSLGSRLEQNFLTGTDSVLSCLEKNEFIDETFQLGYDPRVGVNFHYTAKNYYYVDSTKAYKNVRSAAKNETSTEVDGSFRTQKPLTEQRPPSDLDKTTKTASAKILAAKLQSSQHTTETESSLCYL